MQCEVNGKTYRLENQTPEEKSNPDSCTGCVFAVGDECTQPKMYEESIDFACTGEQGVNMVWRERQ